MPKINNFITFLSWGRDHHACLHREAIISAFGYTELLVSNINAFIAPRKPRTPTYYIFMDITS